MFEKIRSDISSSVRLDDIFEATRSDSELARNFVFFAGKKAFLWSNSKKQSFISKAHFRTHDDLICAKDAHIDSSHSLGIQTELLTRVVDQVERVLSLLQEWEQTSGGKSKPRDSSTKFKRKVHSFDRLLQVNSAAFRRMECAVGIYNGFANGLMALVDRSLIGHSLFRLTPVKIQIQKWQQLSPPRKGSLEALRQVQIALSRGPVKTLNLCLDQIEAKIRTNVVNYPELLGSFSRLSKRGSGLDLLTTKPGLFSRLTRYTLPAEPRSTRLSKLNVRQLRFGYCSDLVFVVTSDSQLVVYDLFRDAICQRFENWGFVLDDLLVRRNLNCCVMNTRANDLTLGLGQLMTRETSRSIVGIDCPGAFEVMQFACIAKQFFTDLSHRKVLGECDQQDEYALVIRTSDGDRLIHVLLTVSAGVVPVQSQRRRNRELCQSMKGIHDSARRLMKQKPKLTSLGQSKSLPE